MCATTNVVIIIIVVDRACVEHFTSVLQPTEHLRWNVTYVYGDVARQQVQ